ncbi:hypothetical protein AK830_g8762 [Neonectria ditissima]|uniref:Uncharacterized protein n=1 Tax=Neonectria ditissima TaxID=78410 RepID=A0A0P7AWL6_9HYPO|nr:hypothetical protein AK830_g8762 [Neonectria ditissima]
MSVQNKRIQDVAQAPSETQFNMWRPQLEMPSLSAPSRLRQAWNSSEVASVNSDDDDDDDNSSRKSIASLSATSNASDDSKSSQPPIGTLPAQAAAPRTGLSEAFRQSAVYQTPVPRRADTAMPPPPLPLPPHARPGYKRPRTPRCIPRGPAQQQATYGHLIGHVPNSMLPPQGIPRGPLAPTGPRGFAARLPFSGAPIAVNPLTPTAAHMPQLSFTPMRGLKRQNEGPELRANVPAHKARVTRLDPTSPVWVPGGNRF